MTTPECYNCPAQGRQDNCNNLAGGGGGIWTVRCNLASKKDDEVMSKQPPASSSDVQHEMMRTMQQHVQSKVSDEDERDAMRCMHRNTTKFQDPERGHN